MRISLSILVLGILCACHSLPRKTSLSYFEAAKTIPIGADKSDVIASLGQPSSEELEEGGDIKMVYSIPYKRMAIPKAIFWLTSQGKISYKHVNLFEETGDQMKIGEIEKRLGKLNLVKVVDTTPRHYISSDRKLHDRRAGVFIDVNEYRGSVSSVGWAAPQSETQLTGK